MSETQLRKEIGNFLTVVDERMLACVHAMLKNYVESEPPKVAFPTNLNPFATADFFDLFEKTQRITSKGKSKSAKDDMSDIPF